MTLYAGMHYAGGPAGLTQPNRDKRKQRLAELTAEINDILSGLHPDGVLSEAERQHLDKLADEANYLANGVRPEDAYLPPG